MLVYLQICTGDELLSHKYSQIYTDDEVLRCLYAIMDHSLLNNVSQLNYIPFLILLSPFLSLCPLLLLPPISWPIASLGSLSSLSSLCPCPVSACLTGSDHLLVLVAKARLLQFT